ncbi:uncharacterized protein BKA78DRAFT_312363 [Phyllosticta capitalensis]|uniref:uncharacterized protein n=1 Tax=Phyllosticta capitalensis TaxID=121624 RepID=UPI0031319F9D
MTQSFPKTIEEGTPCVPHVAHVSIYSRPRRIPTNRRPAQKISPSLHLAITQQPPVQKGQKEVGIEPNAGVEPAALRYHCWEW